MIASVIICTLNRHIELMRCLKSIVKQTRLPDEVLIVDASDEDQLSTLQKSSYFDVLPIKYIRSESGLTRQRNIGINASKGDIIFFFDDDVILDPNYVNRTMEFYEENMDRKIGGVCGIDTFQSFSWLEHRKRLLYYRFFFLSRGDITAKLLPSGFNTTLDMASPEISQAKQPIRVFRFPGGITCYSRFIFGEFMFDEQYVAYSLGEDVDFSHRVAKKYALYCLPTSRLEHRQTQEHSAWYKTADFWRSEINCQGYLFYKHLSANPLNYFALFWSWIGLYIYHGLYWRNPTVLRGIKKGIEDIIKNSSHKGRLFTHYKNR